MLKYKFKFDGHNLAAFKKNELYGIMRPSTGEVLEPAKYDYIDNVITPTGYIYAVAPMRDRVLISLLNFNQEDDGNE